MTIRTVKRAQLKRTLYPAPWYWGAAGAILATLILGPSAVAHSGAPVWSKAQAETVVTLGPVRLNGRDLRVSEVSCFGTGTLRVRVRGVLKFQHFNCLMTPGRERRFWIAVHPLKRGWDYKFLHYA